MTEGTRLSELVAELSKAGASRRATALAGEMGLFIALQTGEALVNAPVRVDLRTVRVSPDGSVEVRGAANCDERTAMTALVAVIEAVVPSPSAAVRALLSRVRSEEISTLAGMCAEIEALLVPLNRSAARRVVGRFAREFARSTVAADSIELSPLPSKVPPASGSALDTVVDSSVPGDDEALVRLPPPPPLGSLMALQVDPSQVDPDDAEPDPRPHTSLAAGVATAGETDPDGGSSALAAALDSAVPDAADTVPDGKTSSVERRQSKRSGSLAWAYAALALVVLTSVLFVMFRWAHRDARAGARLVPASPALATETLDLRCQQFSDA